MAIADIVVSIKGDSRSFTSAATRARQANRGFRNEVIRNNARAATSFDRLEKATFRLRARMIGLRAVAGGVASIFAGRGIVQYADQWRLTQSRIAAVTGDLGIAKQEMAELVQLSNRSRGSIETLASAYSKLRLSRDELNKDNTFDLIETLQKSLIIGGNTPQEVRSVVLQLTQGIAADQLGGEELRTIRESGFFFQKILAEGLGVQVGELKQLGAESKLTAKAVTEAIIKMADKVDEEFDRIPVTVGQASTKLNNNFREWIGVTDEATGATAGLVSGIDLVAENIKPLAEGGLLLAAGTGTLYLSRSFGALGSRAKENVVALRQHWTEMRVNAQNAAFAARASGIKAQADVRAAQASIAAANADIRAATTKTARTRATRQLTVAQAQLTAAELRGVAATNALAAANARAGVAMRTAAFAGGALRGALAFVGGPIGAGILAIAAGFALWSRNARKAAVETERLMRSLDVVASIDFEVTGEKFFQTREQQKAKEQKITDEINLQKEAYAKLRKELEEINSVTRDQTKTVFTGSLGQIQKTEFTPARSLTDDERERAEELVSEIATASANIASSYRTLQANRDAEIVSLEEFKRRRRELNKFEDEGGLSDKQTDKLANSLQGLRDRASELKAEYEALGGSSGAAKSAALAQETINSLVREGITITPTLREEIQTLATSVGQYQDKIRTSREFNSTLEDLRGKAEEARIELQSLGNVSPINEGALIAQREINKLLGKGAELTPEMRAEITRLATEYATLQADIKGAKDAQEAFNERMDDARSLAQQYRTPLEVYRDRIKEINQAQKEFPDIFTQAAAERARAEAVGQYADALRNARDEQLKLSENLAESLVFADSLGDAFRNFGSILQRTLADRLLVKPLTGFIDSTISGLGGLPGKASNDNSGKEVDEFGNIVASAGQQVKGGFVASIVSSIGSLFSKNAAETASAAVTTSATATRTAANTAIVASSTKAALSIGALALAARSAAASLASKNAAGALKGLGGGLGKSPPKFGGFFANGGTLSKGKFGIVGEEGPEIVSATSGPLRITPLKRLPTLSPTNDNRRTNNSTVHMNVFTKDAPSFRKSQATIQQDMAIAQRRAGNDL